MATITASYKENLAAKEDKGNKPQIRMDFAAIPAPITIEAFAMNYSLASMSFKAGF